MRSLPLFAALLSFLLPVAARADTFDYTLTSGSHTVTGVFTTTNTQVGGYYTVIGISGTQNGALITALLAPGVYGNNNNLLSPVSPYFLYQGIAFSVAGEGDSNIYFDSGDTGLIRLCMDTVPCLSGGSGDPATALITPIVEGPEPTSLVLLGSGLVSLAGVTRKRLKKLREA